MNGVIIDGETKKFEDLRVYIIAEVGEDGFKCIINLLDVMEKGLPEGVVYTPKAIELLKLAERCGLCELGWE